MKKKTILYGDNKTIHRTKLLNIEVDKKTKEVVAVWFRCMSLPFNVSLADKQRANGMKLMNKTLKIELEAVKVSEKE